MVQSKQLCHSRMIKCKILGYKGVRILPFQVSSIQKGLSYKLKLSKRKFRVRTITLQIMISDTVHRINDKLSIIDNVNKVTYDFKKITFITSMRSIRFKWLGGKMPLNTKFQLLINILKSHARTDKKEYTIFSLINKQKVKSQNKTDHISQDHIDFILKHTTEKFDLISPID